MIDQQIEIPTKDGHTTTFITHPERGGPFPVILFYMDAPAIREELRDMARRLATSGYYVMLPNLYYRSGVMEIGPINPDPESPERKRMFELMNSINIPLVMEDTTALLAYADTQPAANAKIVGTVGYCMSGRYAVNAATHFPDRARHVLSLIRETRGGALSEPRFHHRMAGQGVYADLLLRRFTRATRQWGLDEAREGLDCGSFAAPDDGTPVNADAQLSLF